MATLLLDTSVLIDTLRGQRRRRELLLELARQGHQLACCAIGIAEVYAGVRPQEVAATERLLENLEYLPMGPEAARLAGKLKSEWARKGQTLALPDLLVAAVAISEDCPLLTGNRKHYPMDQLALYPMPT